MMAKVKNFIQNLQASDESTKKKWLVIASALTMAVVITFWSVYISHTVKSLSAAPSDNNVPSFSEIFNSGLKILGAETMSKVQTFFSGTRLLTIPAKDLKFQVENLEPIKPQALP